MIDLSWLHEVFGVHKPVIGMCHFAALPGDPDYDERAGLSAVVERARADLRALQDGGIDAVMFSNEFSLPYLTKVEPITSIAMARVIAELYPDISVPFGVNVLWDGRPRSSWRPRPTPASCARSSPASTPATSGSGTPTSAPLPAADARSTRGTCGCS